MCGGIKPRSGYATVLGSGSATRRSVSVDFPRVARSCSLLRTGTSPCFVSERLRSKSGADAFTAGKVRVARIYARCGIAAHLNLFLSIKRSDYIIHPTIPSVNSKRAIKKSSFIIHNCFHRYPINKRAREGSFYAMSEIPLS